MAEDRAGSDLYRGSPPAEIEILGRFEVVTTAEGVQISWLGARLTFEEEWGLAKRLMLVIPLVCAGLAWLRGGVYPMIGGAFAGAILGLASAQGLATVINQIFAHLPRGQRNRLVIGPHGWRFERTRWRTRSWSGVALGLTSQEQRENLGRTAALGQRQECFLRMVDMPIGFGFGVELSEEERHLLSNTIESAVAAQR